MFYNVVYIGEDSKKFEKIKDLLKSYEIEYKYKIFSPEKDKLREKFTTSLDSEVFKIEVLKRDFEEAVHLIDWLNWSEKKEEALD